MKSQPSDRRSNRRSRSVSPRDHLLDVQIRTSTARRRRNELVGRWIFNILLVASIGAASFFGIRAALDRFFFHNVEYTLNRISLDLDGIMTREEILAETGIAEGVNIFSVDLGKVEATLKAIPEVQDVRIARELPDHLSIALTARQPVAWIAAEGETGDVTASERSLLVDEAGFLMKVRHVKPEFFQLPVIYGVKSDNIRNGEPLHSEDLRLALTLLATAQKQPESLLHIRTLDISKGYCIDVINDRNARITFAAGDFEEQLQRLQKLLAYCEETERPLQSVNLMVKRNTPVTFLVASAPVMPATKAASSGTKTRRN